LLGLPKVLERRGVIRTLFLPLLLAVAACASTPSPSLSPAAAAEQRAPITILVSIDGFRPDYLDRGITPNLNALAAQGVKAAMRPSFPSKTFPNHYTLVTGLRPDRHGVIDNNMEDPRKPGILFKITNAEASKSFWWDSAEPIWITAEKQGIRTGTSMWPGAEAAWGDRRPSAWIRYDQNITGRQRVDTILDWVRRPAANRPGFFTLYLDIVDTAGHDFGPASAEVNAAVAEVDSELGYLRRELQAMGQPANLVVVSDHGMESTSPERVVRIDRLVEPAAIHVVSDGPFMALAAVAGHEAEVEGKLLGRHPHFECWRKAELPARFHYGRNPRVQPVFCLAEHGWLLYGREPPTPFDLGNHGYDNQDPDMRALFLAAGPGVAHRPAPRLFDNVDIYPFVAALAGVAPLANDGSAATLAPFLRR